jgi:hypothetical protein
MKTTLSFGLVIAAAGTLFACSSDEGTPRPVGGGAGSPSAGVGGSGGGGPATGAGGSAGNAPVTGNGGSGGAPSTSNLGTALTIGELAAGNAPVTDPTSTTGINGAAYLVQSQIAATLAPTTPATFTAPPDKVCMAGNTVIIPGTAPDFNYSEYWGAEIDLDLNRGANPDASDAGAAGDAGDAGAPVLGQTALPWTPPANVLGFSFTIDGPTVPAALRFKTTPTGSDPSADNFCANLSPVSGGTYEVRLDQLVRNCFDAVPGAAVLADPANYTTLQNLGWQVSASPTEAFMFDFCVSNIRPILAP